MSSREGSVIDESKGSSKATNTNNNTKMKEKNGSSSGSSNDGNGSKASNSGGCEWRRVGSCICMIGIASLWVGKSEVLQSLQQSGEEYDQPMFIGWWCTSCYSLFLVIVAIIRYISIKQRQRQHDNNGGMPSVIGGARARSLNDDDTRAADLSEPILHNQLQQSSVNDNNTRIAASSVRSRVKVSKVWYERCLPKWLLGNGKDRLVVLSQCRAALWLTHIFFINSYLYTASLSRTAVSTNTISMDTITLQLYSLTFIVYHHSHGSVTF
jgi:hypothetical protein